MKILLVLPARMTARELQDGADWLYSRSCRLDRILARSARWVFRMGFLQAALVLKLNLTHRRDLIAQGRTGRNPARAHRRDAVRAAAAIEPAVRRAFQS